MQVDPREKGLQGGDGGKMEGNPRHTSIWRFLADRVHRYDIR